MSKENVNRFLSSMYNKNCEKLCTLMLSIHKYRKEIVDMHQ